MDCLPRNRNGRARPSSGIGAAVAPSMSMPARMRGSASMAAMAAAPPAEWPAIAIRDGSISSPPGHAGCAPVSWPRTKPTSSGRPITQWATNATLTDVATTRPVASSASAIPGATTARFVVFEFAMPMNECMIP